MKRYSTVPDKGSCGECCFIKMRLAIGTNSCCEKAKELTNIDCGIQSICFIEEELNVLPESVINWIPFSYDSIPKNRKILMLFKNGIISTVEINEEK